MNEDSKSKVWKQLVDAYDPKPLEDEISLQDFCNMFELKRSAAENLLKQLISDGAVTYRTIKNKRYYRVVK